MRYFWKILLVLIIGAVAAYFFTLSREKKPIPRETPARPSSMENSIQEAQSAKNEEAAASKTPEVAEADSETRNVPEKFSLNIPFYSQAPFSKWDAFHEDMCEEASLLNAGLYLEDKKLSLEKYESELQALQKTEKEVIGEWKSTTITQTKKLADVFFEGKISAKIIDNPTAENIEAEVAAGNPVIVPLAGRDIGNPNFTPPGPVYHMLVIKGYDSKNFIANDVGTRKGESYVYKKEVIMENMHDWNEKDIHLGGKRVLVLMKNS